MEATQIMPEKMDRTNDEVRRTNASVDDMVEQVRRANDGMERANEQVRRTNDTMDKMIEHAKKTNEGMEKMLEQAKKSNEDIVKLGEQLRKNGGASEPEPGTPGPRRKPARAGAHNHALAIALAEMMKPENTRVLTPPTAMMPPGQIYADEASALDIVKLAHAYLKDIDTVRPAFVSAPKAPRSWRLASLDLRHVDHEKRARFAALSVISGLAPQETIDEMIRDEIEDGGRFDDIARAVLMMRFAFIGDVLLKESLFARPLASPALLTEAIRLAEQMHAIASQPFADEIRVKTTGMIDPADNVDMTLDHENLRAVWTRIANAIDTELAVRFKTRANEKTIEALRAKVRERISSVRRAS
jgi:hypothetical protein